MIVEVIRTILVDTPAVAAIAGERWYPVTLPDAPTFPCGLITKVAGPGQYDMEGDAGLEGARVQIDLFHDGGASACIAFKQAVRRRLSGFKGGATSATPCQVQAIFCINDFDLTEPATERAGPRVRRRVLEFIVWNKEV